MCPCPTPVEPASEAMEEERSVPIPRRKSSSFNLKAFNLKRQLSKVDLKIKGKSLKEKRNSIFYSDTSPNQDFDNLEEENHSKSSPESDENTVIDTQAVSPGEAKTLLDEFDGREEYSAEVQIMSDDEAENNSFLVGSVGTQYEVTAGRKVSFTHRPDNLDLVDENGCPVRPPRHLKKKLPDKRDQRLLSVPNIKFQKPAMCDLRNKEERGEPNQPTFAGHLMRRFSKS